jgi:hypothetical protein
VREGNATVLQKRARLEEGDLVPRSILSFSRGIAFAFSAGDSNQMAKVPCVEACGPICRWPIFPQRGASHPIPATDARWEFPRGGNASRAFRKASECFVSVLIVNESTTCRINSLETRRNALFATRRLSSRLRHRMCELRISPVHLDRSRYSPLLRNTPVGDFLLSETSQLRTVASAI